MAAFCDAIRQRDQRCVITGGVDLLRPPPATWSGIALDRSRRDYALLDRPEGAECGTSSAKETTSNRQRMASWRPSQIHSNSASPRASVVVDDVCSITISTPTNDDSLQMESSPSLLVVNKRGPLERLVDILFLGVEDFSKRMNSSEVGEPKIIQTPSGCGFPKTLPGSQHQYLSKGICGCG